MYFFLNTLTTAKRVYTTSWWRPQKVARLEIGKIWKSSWNFAFCRHMDTHNFVFLPVRNPSIQLFSECILGSYNVQLNTSFKLSQITSRQSLFTWWLWKHPLFMVSIVQVTLVKNNPKLEKWLISWLASYSPIKKNIILCYLCDCRLIPSPKQAMVRAMH